MTTEKKQPVKLIVTGLILLVGLPLTYTLEPLWRWVFCMPAAAGSALFLNATLQVTPDAFVLGLPGLPVHVTLACSASGFFVLLLALVLGALSVHRNAFRPLVLPASVGACYVVTLVANITRIVLGWHAGQLSRAALPEPLWGGIHMGVGILVFLMFLIGTHAILLKRSSHERTA